MLAVALVEDTLEDAQTTQEALIRYAERAQLGIPEVTRYETADSFLLDARTHAYDLVLMDIEMNGVDGMTASARYRLLGARQETTPLIFTTRVAQLAAKGYEVDAVGYLVKPFRFDAFSALLDRALARVRLNLESVRLTVDSGSSTKFLDSRDIVFIDVRDHSVCLHLVTGQTVTTWGKLKDYAALLEPVHFVLCNRYTLVNLRAVVGFQTGELTVKSGGDTENISVSRRKADAVFHALLQMKAAQ